MSSTRNRTRAAILDAAATALARNRSATLGEIAELAAVGRTTLHRYFPDREELVRAAVADSLQAIARNALAARLDEGPARDALRRLIAAMVGTYERSLFVWGAPAGVPEVDAGTAPAEADAAVRRLIERAQEEGAVDPSMSVDWVQQVLWAVTYTGGEAGAKGQIARGGVVDLVVRTFESGVRP